MLVAHVTVFFQRLGDDLFQSRWSIRVQPGHGRGILFQDRMENHAAGVSRKSLPPRSHLVDHGAERKQVGPRVEIFPGNLLGRHIGDRADCGTGAGEMLFGGYRGDGGIGGLRLSRFLLRQAEVQNLRLSQVRHKQIRRLDIPMHHALCVRSFERRKNLNRKLQQCFGIERRLACDPLAQRLALQQLHGYERLAVGLVHFVNRADVGVIQRRGRASFATKSLERLRLLFQFLRKEFQRHAAAEFRVLGLVDDAHPAAAQFAEDTVMRNGFSGHWARLGRGV
jgi:hypothetical protein